MRILLWQVLFDAYGDHYFLVALTVAFSLVGVVLWGSVAGSILPFILRGLGFDPASASAPVRRDAGRRHRFGDLFQRSRRWC